MYNPGERTPQVEVMRHSEDECEYPGWIEIALDEYDQNTIQLNLDIKKRSSRAITSTNNPGDQKSREQIGGIVVH